MNSKKILIFMMKTLQTTGVESKETNKIKLYFKINNKIINNKQMIKNKSIIKSQVSKTKCSPPPMNLCLFKHFHRQTWKVLHKTIFWISPKDPGHIIKIMPNKMIIFNNNKNLKQIIFFNKIDNNNYCQQYNKKGPGQPSK